MFPPIDASLRDSGLDAGINDGHAVQSWRTQPVGPHAPDRSVPVSHITQEAALLDATILLSVMANIPVWMSSPAHFILCGRHQVKHQRKT